MRSVSVGELDPEIFIQVDATVGANVGLYHRARHPIRIELVVPGRIKRISPVDPLAIAADLDHLRPRRMPCRLGERLVARCRQYAPTRPAWALGIANVVLAHLAGAPARHIEEPVVEREVDVGDQWRHGAEPLKQRWKLLLLRRLRRNDRGLFAMEFAAVAPPRPNRALEVDGVHHNADKTVFLDRVVHRPDPQR